MPTNPNNYQLLINKLDEFIRKYYKNLLIRGGIYCAGVVLLFYIAVTSLEYYAHFGTAIRTFLFYSFILSNGFILIKLVIIPLARLYKLGEVISHEQAAAIIGQHFTEVQDKLLNTLQLKQQSKDTVQRVSTLIEASINQKISELKPIPFTSAIDLSENRKYLKYAIIPVLLIGIMIFTAPSIITDSTKRLVEHRTYFEKTAPFKFVIQNEDLKTVQQQDFELKVKLTGDEIPKQVFIEIGNNQHRLNKKTTVAFQYLFKNVQKSTVFRLFADGFYSKEYNLTALPNPIVLNFKTLLKYPKYLHKKDDVLQNTGDIIIPTGTNVTWNFTTKNTDSLKMGFSGENPSFFMLKETGENEYSHTGSFFKNTSYSIKTSNKYLSNKDSIAYSINVISDLYPVIEVEEQRDSSALKRIYFTGTIKDDYGFEKLAFKTRFLPEMPDKVTYTDIPVNKGLTQNRFFYFWDISKSDMQAGDEIEYYFEVWDNDGVNGSKSTRSQKMIFKAPTLKDIAENTARKNEEIKNKLEESIELARELQKKLKELDRKMLDKKTLTWEEKKKIQDMLDAQKELQESVKQLQQDAARNFSQQSEFKQVNENILEKQRQLENLFEKIMTDEMKQLFEKMENLLDNIDKSKIQEMLEEMKLNEKDIEKELDRTLELFKQLEFEQKLEEAIDKLDELAKKEETLSEKSSEKNADSEKLKQEQEKLNTGFQDVRKDLKDLEQKNKELEYPNELINTEDEENSIQGEMQESSDRLEKGNNKKASESQKNASDKMKQLSDRLKQMQADMQMQGQEEDLNALRELLENLIQLSFEQEVLMAAMKNTSAKSPQYVKITQDQKKLKDDAKMIEDSLFALSKRIAEIESIVNHEIGSINLNMEKAIELMADWQIQPASSRQQYAMTSINNLALLLSEVVEQIQNQMANQMQGNQSCQKSGCKKSGCQKPGHGKPSISSMKKLQSQLNEQIQQLKDGKNPGGKTGMSEALARLAAQQEAIRNQLQKINQELNKDGQGSLGNLEKLAKMMEQTETDLVHRHITQETIKRQQEILTRLLEAEKADRERETDNKRKSTEAKNENFGNHFEFLEYKALKQRESELLKTVPPSLKPFYKNKVNEYFNNIKN